MPDLAPPPPPHEAKNSNCAKLKNTLLNQTPSDCMHTTIGSHTNSSRWASKNKQANKHNRPIASRGAGEGWGGVGGGGGGGGRGTKLQSF